MTLRKLPNQLINRIAAGEVIERPASATKELVENALDAGSTKIEVMCDDGGLNRIEVRDNGDGISKDELALAMERHATSKLPDDDIFYISTLGFRGEALPSIASISDFKLLSKTKDQEVGWCIDNNGTLTPNARTEGTTVIVRNLFNKTPARRKFLNSVSFESLSIKDIIMRYAMAHPFVQFTLTTDNKLKCNFTKQSGPVVTQTDAFASRLTHVLGKEFSDNCVKVSANTEIATINGFTSLPTYNRGDSKRIYLYVNGRPIMDRSLVSTVRVAYQDYLAKQRYPHCVLFLSLPPHDVDVNVHPTKREVRFKFPQRVRSLIINSIRNSLMDNAHQSSTTVAKAAVIAMRNYSNLKKPRMFSNEQTDTYEQLKESEQLKERESSTSLNQQILQFQAPLKPAAQTNFDINVNSKAIDDFPLGAAVAQIHDTYILAQCKDGLVIVDQHAAHERLVYEALKANSSGKKTVSQPLLEPIIISLNEEEILHIQQSIQPLANLGLIIETFGDDAVIVREVPAILKSSNIINLIKNLAADLANYKGKESLNARLEEIISTHACHTSIRAGRKLQIEEMNGLLRQIEQTPFSGQCNHGRPTYLVLSQHDLEKLFGRK